MQNDSLKKQDKVLIVDDLIATGGTALASSKLVSKMGVKSIFFAFVINLYNLKGVRLIEKNKYSYMSIIDAKVKNMKLGIIGGSGLYNIGNIDKEEWLKVDTPWGSPSDDLLKCTIENKEIIFLPRHGRGHKVNPSNINYRANIDALKQHGVTDIISVSAVGSLKEEHEPGKFIVVDQFIDRTFSRKKHSLMMKLLLMSRWRNLYVNSYQRFVWMHCKNSVSIFQIWYLLSNGRSSVFNLC